MPLMPRISHCPLHLVAAICLMPAICLIPIGAFAANPPLETLVVTASREPRPWLTTPGAVTRLATQSQLPGLRLDSAELLRGLPGLQVDSRSNYAQDTRLVLRGFGARSAFGVRGMDVRLDNIPLAMPDGQAQLGSLLLNEIDSIEILRGPLATLYGNGAGGVIRLHSHAPQDDQLTIAASGGAYDTQKQRVSGSLRAGAWAFRAQASHLESDGYRPHSAVERQQGGAQLYYLGGNGLNVTLRLDASRDPGTQDPSGLSPDQWREDPRQVSSRVETFNTRKLLKHRQVSLNIEKEQQSGAWQLAAWHGRRNVDQWLPFEGRGIESSGAVIDLQRDFTGVQANYRHNARLADRPLLVTLGISVERMEDTRRGYVNESGISGDLRRDEVGTVDSDDLFSIVEWQPTQAIRILGGLRHSRSKFAVEDDFIVEPSTPDDDGNPDDSGSLDFNETSAALGFSYAFAEGLAIFSSIGRGFETPTLTEMAYRNQGAGLGTGLNLQLTPSTNRQIEGGIRFASAGKMQWALMAFTIDSDDELVVDQSVNGRTTYSNAAATERHGLELEGDVYLRSGLSARGSATWLSAEYTEGEWSGNKLPGVAEGQVYAQLRWQPWQSPIATLSFASRYRSRVATSDDNLIWAPDYVTFDLALTSEHKLRDFLLQAWLRLENLTDKTYVGSVIVNQDSGRSFEPAPGRTVTAGIDVEF